MWKKKKHFKNITNFRKIRNDRYSYSIENLKLNEMNEIIPLPPPP